MKEQLEELLRKWEAMAGVVGKNLDSAKREGNIKNESHFFVRYATLTDCIADLKQIIATL